MKKYVLYLILGLFLSLSCYSQNIDQLLRKVSQTETIEKVKINGFMMSMAKMFGEIKDIPIAKGISSLEVYTLSNCAPDLKEDFTKLFNNAKEKGSYETLIFVKEEGKGIRIMVKKEKDTIKDMVLLCMEENEPTIIKFSGKIKEKDLTEFVNKYKN